MKSASGGGNLEIVEYLFDKGYTSFEYNCVNAKVELGAVVKEAIITP